MILRRLAGLSLLLCGGLLASCGTSGADLCEQICDCTGCSDSELDECVDSAGDIEKVAEEEGCSDQYDDIVACYDNQFRCTESRVDLDGCGKEEKSFSNCIGSTVSVSGGPIGGSSFCEAVCDCAGGCDSDTRAQCQSEIDNLSDSADAAGCSGEFNQLLGCWSNDVSCVDGQFALDGCDGELNVYSSCVGGDQAEPAPAE